MAPPDKFESLEEAKAFADYNAKIQNLRNDMETATYRLKDKIGQIEKQITMILPVHGVPTRIGNHWVLRSSYQVIVEEVKDEQGNS
jgi:hypothetical protein